MPTAASASSSWTKATRATPAVSRTFRSWSGSSPSQRLLRLKSAERSAERSTHCFRRCHGSTDPPEHPPVFAQKKLEEQKMLSPLQRIRSAFARTMALAPDDLLRDATYRRLWSSILISSFGAQVTMLALP